MLKGIFSSVSAAAVAKSWELVISTVFCSSTSLGERDLGKMVSSGTTATVGSTQPRNAVSRSILAARPALVGHRDQAERALRGEGLVPARS